MHLLAMARPAARPSHCVSLLFQHHSTSQTDTGRESLDLVQESDSDSELSVVEDSGEEMSPVVQPQAQQQKQKRVQFDENLDVRVYLASQEELEPNSASDSDDSDGSDDSDDAPPTPPPIIDETSLLRQPEHVRNDTLSERATLPSEPDETEDVHFGFSFETKKHQAVHNQTSDNQTLTESDSIDDSERVSDNSQVADITLAGKKPSSSKQQPIVLPAEVQPAPAADAEDFSGDHPIDPVADDESSGYDHMGVELGDPGGRGQHSPSPMELDESDEEAPEANFETRHLTETAIYRQTQDELQQGQRKSQRMKFRPLAYHMGERVHYHRSAAVRTVHPER